MRTASDVDVEEPEQKALQVVELHRHQSSPLQLRKLLDCASLL
jgi:hypothetical protein